MADQTQERKRYDTTERGGRYEVNGKLVDANGQPVKSTASKDGDKKKS